MGESDTVLSAEAVACLRLWQTQVRREYLGSTIEALADSHEALRAALADAVYILEDYRDRLAECECVACPECGQMPAACTGTACAQTCACSTCLYCGADWAVQQARAALGGEGGDDE